MTTRTVSKWLFGIEGANVRLGRSPSLRSAGIVEVSVRGKNKTLAMAQTYALRKYAKSEKTNEIALKVVSIKQVKGAEVKTFLDVYATAETIRTTQPISQVIYDSAKSTDSTFSYVAPAPKFTNFSIGNMTLKVRQES